MSTSNKSKKIIAILLSIFIAGGALGVYILKMSSQDSVFGGEIFDSENDSKVFTCTYFNDTVKIALNMSDVNEDDKENVNFDNLEYEIINPSNEVVKSGELVGTDRIRFDVDAKKGEWKIRFKLENDRSQFIDFSIEKDPVEKDTEI